MQDKFDLFFKELEMDSYLRQKFELSKSIEEAFEVAKPYLNGVDFTTFSKMILFVTNVFAENGRLLGDDELENIWGGLGFKDVIDYFGNHKRVAALALTAIIGMGTASAMIINNINTQSSISTYEEQADEVKIDESGKEVKIDESGKEVKIDESGNQIKIEPNGNEVKSTDNNSNKNNVGNNKTGSINQDSTNISANTSTANNSNNYSNSSNNTSKSNTDTPTPAKSTVNSSNNAAPVAPAAAPKIISNTVANPPRSSSAFIVDATMKPQENGNWCGAASAQALINSYFKKKGINATVTQQEVIQKVLESGPIHPAGLNLIQISNVIQSLTLQYGKQAVIDFGDMIGEDIDKRAQMIQDSLKKTSLPVILYKSGHWLIVNGIDMINKKVYYKDTNSDNQCEAGFDFVKTPTYIECL